MTLFVLGVPIRGFFFVSRHSPHVVKLCVRSHVSQVGHAVGQSKEGSNGSNVPNILSVKTMSLQAAEMFFSYGFTPADCQRKVQHGLLTSAQLRNPVINCNLWDKTVPVNPLILFIIFLENWVWEGVEQVCIMFIVPDQPAGVFWNRCGAMHCGIPRNTSSDCERWSQQQSVPGPLLTDHLLQK